jgi:hypothetical protein
MMKPARFFWILPLAALCSAAERDPVETLARFGASMKENISRMAGLACVEKIERYYYRARVSDEPQSCDDLAAAKKRRGYRLELEARDRIRFDVRSGSTHEMYSWPGANLFDDGELWNLIHDGPAATGPFAMLPLQIVQGDATDFAFLGETEVAGRKLYEYSFRVPEARSHYFIHLSSGPVTTAWSGNVLIDPETFDLVRLTTRTSELPRAAFSCEISSTSDYAHESVGGRDFLLSRETRQRFIEPSGKETESVVTFSACRDEPRSSTPAPKAVAAVDLPAGLPVQIELETSIDSETASGGDTFTGRISKPVLDARKQRTLLPEATRVSGRLLKVAQRMRPAEVGIVLKIETALVDGVERPIHLAGRVMPQRGWLANLLSTLSVSGGMGGGAGGGMSAPTVEYHPATIEGEYNPLTFPGSRKIIEPGFKTEWETTEPVLGKVIR